MLALDAVLNGMSEETKGATPVWLVPASSKETNFPKVIFACIDQIFEECSRSEMCTDFEIDSYYCSEFAAKLHHHNMFEAI